MGSLLETGLGKFTYGTSAEWTGESSPYGRLGEPSSSIPAVVIPRFAYFRGTLVKAPRSRTSRTFFATSAGLKGF